MAIAGTAAPKAAKPKVDTVSTRQLGAALAEKHDMSHKAANAILEDTIGQTRGSLESESVLGQLAVQFGRAIGSRGALRDAIGKVDSAGTWKRQQPDPTDPTNHSDRPARRSQDLRSRRR